MWKENLEECLKSEVVSEREGVICERACKRRVITARRKEYVMKRDVWEEKWCWRQGGVSARGKVCNEGQVSGKRSRVGDKKGDLREAV